MDLLILLKWSEICIEAVNWIGLAQVSSIDCRVCDAGFNSNKKFLDLLYYLNVHVPHPTVKSTLMRSLVKHYPILA
jgi:hypothetical protein